ncbi:type I-MYXAN CRISPR-associated protein Cas6/Cmx6 [Waterburya agarophytonicola K14]|uniref:Type I-MYXAN CRISPR-associated protein Cas6/Cmx6 n=1 Tax=Waterburya agarophytonicola KI4 TaxID=2874699 RepID=A0A964FIF5_9CYAN|nr:type I-MYXAN CRISPR-associated protein Cas6/Cmx6 [Waterburya agarophytonicola]MCC0179847.1 type I-MYXAN CRISPR-associated protein Cas6/Cmx6 [Waterburya agarophytonicola KI4]
MAIAQVGREEQQENIELIQNPYIELAFPVIGQSLPIDHGYQLYSALKYKLMQLKDWDEVSIKTISGKLDRNTRNQLNLTDRSKLLIRLPSEKVPFVYTFSGKSLTIGKHKIRLGIPEMNFLQPKSRLRSHIVVIRGYEEPNGFLEAAKRQIEILNIKTDLKLIAKKDGTPKPKTIRVKQILVGFGIEANNLSESDSIILQEKGLGGKHKMGCGVFV